MFSKTKIVGLLIGGLALTGVSIAQADTGAEKAVLCAGCHGADGISLAPDIPNLAGQKEVYLEKAIKDYRAGRRANPMMSSMAAGLSDDDIKILAGYFSKLKK